jgi:hypothetical protein
LKVEYQPAKVEKGTVNTDEEEEIFRVSETKFKMGGGG